MQANPQLKTFSEFAVVEVHTAGSGVLGANLAIVNVVTLGD